MKRFIIKCLIFLIPIIGIFLFPAIIFWLSGEFLSMSTVVERQQKDSQNVLYQSAFTSATDRPYKVLSTTARDPEIIVIGLSRTLSFRSDFFKDGDKFYNVGRGIHNTSDLLDYLKSIPVDSSLKVVLFDVSGMAKDAFKNDTEMRTTTLDMIRGFLRSGWRDAYLDYVQGKYSISSLIQEKRNLPSIGLSAIIKRSGYRKDGSLERGEKVTPATPETLASEIISNISGVKNDSEIDDKNMKEIETFLKLSQERNIYVIGYLSPYASKVYETISEINNSDGDTFRTLPVAMTSLFKRNGFNFYDLRDIKIIGSSDIELYDAGHMTEKGTIRLLSYLLNREPKLETYVDDSSLKGKMKKEKY